MTDPSRRIDWLLVSIVLTITAFHGLGVRQVPFHPDETSLLYQSADLEAWVRDPLSVAWDPSKVTEYDQAYRTLNPPLPKIILGIGRRVAGFGPDQVSVDWDWSMSWDANRAAGALPGEALLTSARLANILLLPVSLMFLYMSGLKIGGRSTGIIGVVLLGTNALVLLHARRAMAEAAVIFGVSLAIFGFVQARDKPWLAGLGAATAVLSKLSTAALAPVGLVLVIWPGKTGLTGLRNATTRAMAYLGAFALEVFVFDPLLWRHPFQAMAAVWRARLDLLASQVAEIGAAAPSLILRSPGERLASLIGNTFLMPPQFAEVGNYVTQTAPQVESYLAIPGNELLRGVFAGGLVLGVCLLGVFLAVIRWPRLPGASRVPLSALAIASAAQTAALYAAIPLPFQRYYLPLIPFICLWVAYGVSSAGAVIRQEMRGILQRRAGYTQ